MNKTVEEILKLHTTVDTTVDIIESDLTPIQEFYKDSNVFVTGCSGFLGQVLLEKLLRSCPVSKIFILMRKKKGKEIDARIDEIFDDPLFQRIKNQFPEKRDKVVPIEGDCVLPFLGICEQDRKLLIDNVDIVFHVAATVRFDEKIKTAVHTNIRSLIDLFRMARQMPRLKSFMHTSTGFCNCSRDRRVICEEVYPPAVNYKDILLMVENMEEKILEQITPRLTEDYPNTYTFTKQIAEDAVKQEGQGLPVGIHRPAIVISTYKEPIRGWINNVYGATGILAGAAVGLLRVMNCNGNYNANMVPVDMCVNSMIAAAWDVAQSFKKAEVDYEPIVYNCESSNDQPILWKDYMAFNEKYGTQIGSMRCIWYYCLILEKNHTLYSILVFLLHTIPAFLVDAVLLCIGKPTMMLKAYKKIHKFTKVVAFFCTNEWKFESNNIQQFIKKMTERDRHIFFSDFKELDWDEYYKTYAIGGRSYLLKDPIDTVPKGIARYRRLYWAHQAVKTILCAIALWAIWALTCFVLSR